MSFVVVHAMIEIKPDHKFSLMFRTYFNFLNTIIGRGVFLIFMALMLAEKSDQGEIFIAIIVIVVGICDIVLGWNQDKQDIPNERW
jgi:hypothetical protein